MFTLLLDLFGIAFCDKIVLMKRKETKINRNNITILSINKSPLIIDLISNIKRVKFTRFAKEISVSIIGYFRKWLLIF